MALPVESSVFLAGVDGLDRDAERRAEPDLLARLLADPRTRVLRLAGDRTRVEESPAGARLALGSAAPGEEALAYLGRDGDGTAYVLVAGPAGDDADLVTLRAVGTRLTAREASMFATATGLANWHATHTYCPRCGSRTAPAQAGWTRLCPQDGSQHFPRTDPAVIMTVVDDEDRLLLARGAGFTTKGLSVLAGFVEPGESLAAAVRREVAEEVGLVVHEVRYVADQPWPFPSSLMIGFHARTHGGDVRLQEDEIETARWFTRDELAVAVRDGDVHISGRLSIARTLIEEWYGGPIDAPEVSLRPPRAAS